MPSSSTNDRGSASKVGKVILGLLAAIALLAALWFTTRPSPTTAPARTTTEARPNSEQNIPDTPDQSVKQNGNPEADTTPSPHGSGANTMLEQSSGTPPR